MTAPAVLRVPQWELTINGKNVTADISGDVSEITFTDKLHGESDELSVTIENRDLKWLNAWFPTTGDEITLKLGYRGQALVKVGTLELDEPTWHGTPHVVTLKAIAASVTAPLRTKRHRGFDKTKLADIVDDVAEKAGLTVTGVIPDVIIGRATQSGERDLAFLKRVADREGYVVTVRGTELVFTNRAELGTARSIRTYALGDVLSYEFTRKRTQTYQSAVLTYEDPVTGTIEGHAGAPIDPSAEASDASTDVLRLFERAADQAEADRICQARLTSANLGERTGTLELEGDPAVLAGVRITITGAGKLSGIWQVKEATHTITRDGGYVTRCTIQLPPADNA